MLSWLKIGVSRKVGRPIYAHSQISKMFAVPKSGHGRRCEGVTNWYPLDSAKSGAYIDDDDKSTVVIPDEIVCNLAQNCAVLFYKDTYIQIFVVPKSGHGLFHHWTLKV